MNVAEMKQNDQPIIPNAENENEQYVQVLFPKCLEMIGNTSKTAELRVSFDAPTNQTTYQYSIVWEDNSKDAEEKYRVAITEANKIMLALKKKKKSKSSGLNIKQTKKSGNAKPLEEQLIEKQDPGVQFPPDLRSRSEQQEKPKPTNIPIPTFSDSDFSSKLSSLEVSNIVRKYSRSSKKSSKNMTNVGCLDADQNICFKVFVIDTANFRGKLKPKMVSDTTVSTRIQIILMAVLREYYSGIPPEQLLKTASVLFAFQDKSKNQKVRRIRQLDVEKIIMSSLPVYRGSVVLVIDLIGFVTKGKKVPLQIDNIEE